MTASGDGATVGARAAVWCVTCGIPYAADTVYCAHCGATLTELPAVPAAAIAGSFPVALAIVVEIGEHSVPEDGAPAPAATVPRAAEHEQRRSASAPLATPTTSAPTLDGAFPGPPRGLLDRVRQRQRAMSEDEVDAAAAIIARARSADEPVSPVGAVVAPPDALVLLADLLPDPALADALQRQRERDRLWLIVGVACSVLLIVFALAVSRYLSVGLLRH